jgi:Flp pilus assembly protein TadG
MRDMLLSRFVQDRRGAVAPMFALAIIPLIGLTGAAIDYSRANSVRAGMQAALDATSLAMAKLAPTLTSTELATKTNAYFQAMFTHPEAKNIVLTPSYSTTGGSQLTIAVSGSMDTTFMNVLGISKIDLGSSSTVKWGMNRLRVALVLDNTGSMASAGKMEALKTAAKSLITQLKSASTTKGDVYISIIPFNKDVNVGKTNFASSIRWDLWDAANNSGGNTFSGSICYNGTLWQVNGTSWSNGGSCSGQSTGICYQGTLYNWNGSTFTTGGSCSSHGSWNGCVTDRDQDYDTTNTAPSASTQATLFPAEQFGACPEEMMPLSDNWDDLNKKIDKMKPEGNTNQTIGLQWGFQSLTAAPFTIPAKDANYTYDQVIILLTDGLNTQNRFSTTQSTIDERTKKACDNINAANITLYTIQVSTDGDAISTMLKNCAGTASPGPGQPGKYPDPDKNFFVTSTSGIGTVFSQIATKLSKLRISN